ncbi:oligopeptide transporter, OPT family [Saccharibacter sp. 17.LH.SD]|uniref:OPT family oligopeptide transporter n=1 Tax=Saccharibacter sp. 17.LH.SD TaxID=2689393 RepID=UPI00136AE1A6|nr:oligopeptide transporter, OPT family [Saccharibacter sp. 17.LH.SD]MXV44717.1 oligopeptide transporter, OPT family [Saccharibacter sp. 17.LH.SD]
MAHQQAPHRQASSTRSSRELTFRGMILGAFITIIFTAANVYLGLKLGLTFASSIPAAIISMVVLRFLGNSSILENNMVQTQASSAGTLSCVFAALPGLILVGWWQNFPYLLTALLTMAGGMTGVLFTIPLRRALVTESNLPYPEGAACAEILQASSPDKDRQQLRLLGLGSAVSAIVNFSTAGLNCLASGFSVSTRYGASAFSLTGSFSLALLGTGYLVGLAGGITMLLGVLLAWDVIVPLLGHITPSAHPIQDAPILWSHKVRFIGAGVIAVAALWTLLCLSRPVYNGVKSALSRSVHLTHSEEDRDLSPRFITWLGCGLAGLLFITFMWFLSPSHLSFLMMSGLSLLGTLLCLVLGFIVASTCGYMAGIVGSSSSPISGVGIIAIIVIGFGFSSLETTGIIPHAQRPLLIAFSLFILSAITASAAISNDNLQDLKTGQLLGASPWKQETALLIGCVVGALVIPLLLNIIYQAYGLAGHLPRPGMNPADALPAPQPALMAALANGIITHSLDWHMLEIGAALGAAIIFIDYTIQKKGLSLPPLALGMGLYLPADVSVTIAIGALLGAFLKRGSKQNGTMLASGFIVGESLMGIILAGISSLTGRTNSLSLQLPTLLPHLAGWGIFIGVCLWFSIKTYPSLLQRKDS